MRQDSGATRPAATGSASRRVFARPSRPRGIRRVARPYADPHAAGVRVAERRGGSTARRDRARGGGACSGSAPPGARVRAVSAPSVRQVHHRDRRTARVPHPARHLPRVEAAQPGAEDRGVGTVLVQGAQHALAGADDRRPVPRIGGHPGECRMRAVGRGDQDRRTGAHTSHPAPAGRDTRAAGPVAPGPSRSPGAARVVVAHP
ncbi:hypothetical protein EAO76_09390 [Streptomyces sp. sk2.1]|nr:hypothetical protein EAO76_09390 [Streptomyces sp. sk2.1]